MKLTRCKLPGPEVTACAPSSLEANWAEVGGGVGRGRGLQMALPAESGRRGDFLDAGCHAVTENISFNDFACLGAFGMILQALNSSHTASGMT